MARYLCLPLIVLVLLLTGSSRAAAPAVAAADPVQGDVTCDSSVNSVDSLQILRDVAGLGTTAGCLAEAGDVNCDGAVNSVDSLRILRYVAGLTNTTPDGCAPIGEPLGPPATSEALIAAALEAGEITFEESLLERAYALYADPRQDPQFRSPIMDLEASTRLFGEVEQSEGQLSQGLLADLAPFRARPNDPISPLYDLPVDAGVSAQGPANAWQSEVIPGTNARVWAFGPPGAQVPFMAPISTVWSAFLGTFVYPNPDAAGNPSMAINPDSAIDFYVVDINGIDPRATNCSAHPSWCTVGSRDGFAQRAAPFPSNKSSGYLVINARTGGIDNLIDTVAHELAHVSQFSYDKSESTWLAESTATWVAYRVMKDLGKTPQWAYDRAGELYDELEQTLNREDAGGNDDRYGSWLFFQHAAMVAGDAIVSAVWDHATPLGVDDVDAVDAAFNLDENFDEFTVRNWNIKPPVEIRYKDAPDPTFPNSLKPELDRDLTVPGEADYTLDLPVEPLSARYYRYVFESPVRHIIFENNLVETEHAHVWLLKKIDGDWKPPEDMAGAAVQTWCRDSETFDEDLEELIVIVSYSEISGSALNHHHLRVITDKLGCYELDGWMETTLRVVDDGEDMTYTSGRVNLRWTPREIQDEPGNVQYDLSSQSQGVHWVASGTIGGCPAEGDSTVLFPGVPYTGVELAAGYLVVVGPGDWHGGLITAYDPDARVTVTCPGDPPYEYETSFDAAYLYQVQMTPNGHTAGGLVLEGDNFWVFGDMTYHFKWHFVRHDELASLH